MRTKFRFLALVFAVATLSLQCTTDDGGTPELPLMIDQYFKAGSCTVEGKTLNYQTSHINTSQQGDAPLVVVLHGQYANGSDNESQLHQDAMIKIWNYLSTSNTKAIMFAPQCPSGSEWDENPEKLARLSMPELLKATLDEYINKQPGIDTSRIYIIGYSDAYKPAGGGGVWRMLNGYSDMFAGAMIVAADPDDTISPSKVAKTPVLYRWLSTPLPIWCTRREAYSVRILFRRALVRICAVMHSPRSDSIGLCSTPSSSRYSQTIRGDPEKGRLVSFCVGITSMGRP